jgi:hypothetical protein
MGRKMNAERYLVLLARKLRMLSDVTYERALLDLRLEELADDIEFFLESDGPRTKENGETEDER